MLKTLFQNNHFLSVVAQLGSSGIAIVSFIILARSMSQEMFGQWGLFLALLSFLDLLKSGLVATALVKYSSGESEEVKVTLLASSWILNLLALGGITIVFIIVYQTGWFSDESILLFLFYYPIYGVLSMPYHYNVWNSQIEINIKRMAKIRILNAVLFLIVCVLTLFNEFELNHIVIGYVIAFACSSIISILTGNTGITTIKKFSKQKIKRLIIFGRYHMLVFLGSNLLRSSDTFLISAFLGNKALAIYIIPQRLWMLVIMPLASAITIGFPIFSANHNKKMYGALKRNIERYIGVLTLLYIPFAIVLFLTSDYLVLLVGGEKYLVAADVFRIFLIYSIFVPFDQIMGVSLDAVNRPNKNFIKVTIMTVVNIIGDLIVLKFYPQIELVAWVTLGTTLSGVIAGYFMLRKVVKISITSIFSNGYKTLLLLLVKFMARARQLQSKNNVL